MNELQKIAFAQDYIEKMANGINPLSGETVGDSDLVNNIHISRCLFYVSGILKDIVNNKGKYKAQLPERAPFSLSDEQAARFQFSETPIAVSEITKRLNSLIDPICVKELKNGVITNWLNEVEMLEEYTVNNKKKKRPSQNGLAMGISVEQRISKMGVPYEAVFYDLKAQHFIIDNIDAIIASQK